MAEQGASVLHIFTFGAVLAGHSTGRYLHLVSSQLHYSPAILVTFSRLQEETARVEEHLLEGSFTKAIIKCFTTSKANAFENLLEPLQKLLRLSPPVALTLAHPEIFSRIHQKLQSNKALTRLNLLRIVQSICDASDEQGALINIYGLYDAIQRLAEADSAILVRDMASKLIRSCKEHEILLKSGGKRRPGRRTSTSTTPPSLNSSQSMPPTPTSNRSSHSTTYFPDRDSRQRNVITGHMPFRTAGREEPATNGMTEAMNGMTGAMNGMTGAMNGSSMIAKSRLPRTTSGRNSRQSMLPSPTRAEPALRSSPIPGAPPAMVPNSRRRRQASGESRWT